MPASKGKYKPQLRNTQNSYIQRKAFDSISCINNGSKYIRTKNISGFNQNQQPSPLARTSFYSASGLDTNLETRWEVSYNHNKNFNKLERGISAMVNIYKTKHYGSNMHGILNGRATSLAIGSLVLKMKAQDIPWCLIVDLVWTIYLLVGSATCLFLSGLFVFIPWSKETFCMGL